MSDIKRNITRDISAYNNDYINYSGTGRSDFPSDIVTITVEADLDRVSALLAGVSHGVDKAVGSALKRAAAVGKTIAKQYVTKEYILSQREFLARTKNYNHIDWGDNGEISVMFGFRGHVIPLMVFDTKVDKRQ